MEQTHAIQDKVDEVATAVEEIGNSMTLTLKALAEGKQDIEHLASEVEASVDNGTEVTEKLENLNQYMDEMNSIVELIGGITNQTSLLALNASIEAARAGEAGRGFSVVATEISGMATRTKEATVHITELISNVSNAIMEVVGVVSNMVDGINEEKTGASNAEESFESIEDSTRAIQKNADTHKKEMQASIAEFQEGRMDYFNAFWVGGLICALVQILMEKTKLMPGRIMVLLVCSGAVLSFLGIYEPFKEFAGAGASVPLLGFGHVLMKGVKEAVDQSGFMGVFEGGFRAGAIGCSAALVFGLIAAFVSKNKI